MLGAAFFLPIAGGEPPVRVEEAARLAGVDGDRWGSLAWRDLLVERLRWHDLFSITFRQYDFLDLLADDSDAPLPLVEDPALPFALAFRAACEALDPAAAVVVTRPQ